MQSAWWETSDLLPLGDGELLRERGDGVLELQDAGVSLCKGIPQTLKLFGQTSELCLCLLKLDLIDTKHQDPEASDTEEKINSVSILKWSF